MTQRFDRGLLPAHLGQTNWHITRYNDSVPAVLYHVF